MNNDTNNYRLATRARDGDENALSELIEHTRLRLYALAYAELRHYDDAHDVVVAALVQICLHIGQLQEPEHVDAWMNAIVRNEVRQHCRRRDPAPSEIVSGEINETRRQTDSCMMRLDIEQALERLPQDQAQVIVLFYWQRLSTLEIAAQLHRPEGTIRRWLHLGRQQLAIEMKEYEPMKPTDTAAIVHTDLSATQLRQLKKALRAGGYNAQIFTPSEITSVTYGSGLTGPLAGCAFVILDEFIGGRSALEYVMFVKSLPDTACTPICVLCSDTSDFTAGAYFVAGVDRLADRNRTEDMERLQLLNLRLMGKRIVVVEDEEITRQQLSAGLSRVGLTVVGMAANGEDGVALVLRERPDIVLMDIEMPVMDGLEATRQIMAQYRTCIIMLTAYSDWQEKAWQAGASGYITKPLTGISLRLQIHEALDRFHRKHGIKTARSRQSLPQN